MKKKTQTTSRKTMRAMLSGRRKTEPFLKSVISKLGRTGTISSKAENPFNKLDSLTLQKTLQYVIGLFDGENPNSERFIALLVNRVDLRIYRLSDEGFMHDELTASELKSSFGILETCSCPKAKWSYALHDVVNRSLTRSVKSLAVVDDPADGEKDKDTEKIAATAALPVEPTVANDALTFVFPFSQYKHVGILEPPALIKDGIGEYAFMDDIEEALLKFNIMFVRTLDDVKTLALRSRPKKKKPALDGDAAMIIFSGHSITDLGKLAPEMVDVIIDHAIPMVISVAGSTVNSRVKSILRHLKMDLTSNELSLFKNAKSSDPWRVTQRFNKHVSDNVKGGTHERQ